MKKAIIYFMAMMLCVVAGILTWEASPAIAEKIGIETSQMDVIAGLWLLPAIVFSGLFNETREARQDD